MKQKGFTLIELLVALGVGSVVLTSIVTGIFIVVPGTIDIRGKTVALNDIENAAHWLTRDIVMGQTTSLMDGAPPVDNMTLTWSDLTDWVEEEGPVAHSVSYTYLGTAGTPVTISAGFSILLMTQTKWESWGISTGSWKGDTWRTGIDFDTTDIPDTAIITNVKLKLYIDDDGGELSDVDKMTSSAFDYNAGDDKAGFWADVDGNTYLSNSDGFAGQNAYHTVELLPAARTDLQNQLGDNWFSVGWTGVAESGDVYRDGRAYDEANPPQLIVTYTLAPAGPGVTKLQRDYDGVVTTVGRHLTNVEFSIDGRLVTVTLTASRDGTPRSTVTRRYLIRMRAESEL